jgi:hypothetical protein
VDVDRGPGRRRRLRLVAAAVGLVVLVAAGVVVWRLLDRPTDYERAVGYLPPDTLRASWTDWAAVRSSARGDGLDASSPRGKVEAFLSRAFDQDLTSTSALAESTYALSARYGVSPLDASWELLGQSREGQVVVLALPEGADPGGIEQRLRRLGYDEPAGGIGSGGTWEGSADLVASIDPDLTPVQQNFAVLPQEGLVLMSDAPEPVSTTADIIRGDAEGLDVATLASMAGSPVTAILWASDFACEDLAMSAADEEDQRVAAQLVDRAGGVSPLTGLVIAQQADRTLTVGMLFETSAQASDNLQPRVDLAAGKAPGQGGSFADRFRVTSGEADGRSVVLRFEPVDGADFVFSDISQGPVLFATC